MNYEEFKEAEQILEELNQFNYKKVKPKVERLTELLAEDLERERHRHYRVENKLKSSVDREIVKELVAVQNFLNGIQTMNKRAYEEVGHHDKATVDLLHALEFSEDNESLDQFISDLRDNRRMRREAKDFVELTKPIVHFMTRNKQAIKELNQVVDEVRDIESKLATRTYTPRVLTDMKLALDKAEEEVENDTK